MCVCFVLQNANFTMIGNKFVSHRIRVEFYLMTVRRDSSIVSCFRSVYKTCTQRNCSASKSEFVMKP